MDKGVGLHGYGYGLRGKTPGWPVVFPTKWRVQDKGPAWKIYLILQRCQWSYQPPVLPDFDLPLTFPDVSVINVGGRRWKLVGEVYSISETWRGGTHRLIDLRCSASESDQEQLEVDAASCWKYF